MTAANREAAGRNERPLPPFPAKQMFVLGTELSLHDFATLGLTIGSLLQNMRTDCLHVHLPLHLLHDPRFQHYR
jgi:hypothetical protein